MQFLLGKVYDGDSILDLEEDIIEAINSAKLPTDEFNLLSGSFKIEVLYDNEKTTEEDWEE